MWTKTCEILCESCSYLASRLIGKLQKFTKYTLQILQILWLNGLKVEVQKQANLLQRKVTQTTNHLQERLLSFNCTITLQRDIGCIEKLSLLFNYIIHTHHVEKYIKYHKNVWRMNKSVTYGQRGDLKCNSSVRRNFDDQISVFSEHSVVMWKSYQRLFEL